MNHENHLHYENFILLGTSHISKESLNEVEYLVNKFKPDFIALELDPNRLYSLLQKEKQKHNLKTIFKVGIKGYFFALIASWAAKKLGEYTGVPPGSEMKKAVNLARKNDIKIALIDQDISITLKKLSSALTWKEKFTFVSDFFKGIFTALFKKDKVLQFDIRTVPAKDIIKKMLLKVKKSYPNIYKVLLTDRNHFMAHNLINISKQNPDKLILTVIGAGHLEGITKLLKKHYP